MMNLEKSYSVRVNHNDASTKIVVLGHEPHSIYRKEWIYRLLPGLYSIYSTPGGELGKFKIDNDGNISLNLNNNDVLNVDFRNMISIKTKGMYLNGNEIDTNICISNLPRIGIGGRIKFNLPIGCEYNLHSRPGGTIPHSEFIINKDGKIKYDKNFDNNVLKGLGTNELYPIGKPIFLSGKKIDTNICISNLDYIGIRKKKCFRLPVGKDYILYSHPGGTILYSDFEVKEDGTLGYNSIFDGKILEINNNNELTILGKEIEVDVGNISSKISISNLKAIDPTVNRKFSLPIRGRYTLHSKPGGTIPYSNFTVNENGNIDYISYVNNVILTGLGTKVLGIVSKSIRISNKISNILITVPDLEWIRPGNEIECNLPIGCKYFFYTARTGNIPFSEFTINIDGKIEYETICDDILEGRNTKSLILLQILNR